MSMEITLSHTFNTFSTPWNIDKLTNNMKSHPMNPMLPTLLLLSLLTLTHTLPIQSNTSEPNLNYNHKMDMPGLSGVTLYWNISLDSQRIDMAVSARDHDGYVAFGVNDHAQMIGADAVIGWIDAQGEAHIGTFNLTSKKSVPVNLSSVYQITDADVVYYNGMTTIMFSRLVKTGQHEIVLDGKTIVLASIGHTPDPDIHKHIHRVKPCCPRVEFSTGRTSEGTDLKIVHGIGMFIAWTLVLPIGILCARYLKRSPDALWWLIHRVSQPVGFGIALISLGIIIYETQAVGSDHFASAHPIGGLVLMIITLIQFIAAILRPHQSEIEKNCIRGFWEHKHRWLGRILILTSWIVSTFGLCHYTGEPLPQCITHPDLNGLFIGYFAVVGILIIVIIGLEINMRIYKRNDYIQVEPMIK
eukprot:TRINITY_DN4577_c0_g1_i1.p1 TRINITY_DN4577_c0_g1~~TRINITY_DN4577_c0_g1_i1.p1  ORF type:complete len:415 (-),score=68.41 TRINITY_DN4577_c0_g1_i1:97-1341(-)